MKGKIIKEACVLVAGVVVSIVGSVMTEGSISKIGKYFRKY